MSQEIEKKKPLKMTREQKDAINARRRLLRRVNCFIRELRAREARFNGHDYGKAKGIGDGVWKTECTRCGATTLYSPPSKRYPKGHICTPIEKNICVKL